MFLRQVLTIAAKDLRAEWRTREAFNASFAFMVVILVLFSFAFDPSSEQLQTISGGLLWLVFSFAGALILNRSFARELQNDCLDALISSPAPAGAIFLGNDSPTVLGDYVAGPSHTLPAGGTGASFAGLTVDQFQRRTSLVEYKRAALKKALKTDREFAALEGLEAHERSAEIRFQKR